MDRRTFLNDCIKIGAVSTIALNLESCGLFDDPEMKVCTVSELQENGFLVKSFNGDDIFLTYLEDKLTIFSMVCRHKKCTVKYNADKEKFLCPCHDGIYDKHGKVLSGPPPKPLRQFKWEIRNEEIWVLNQEV